MLYYSVVKYRLDFYNIFLGCGIMNAYYEQLAQLIIKNPSLSLLNGEVCFYEGSAKSYQKVTHLVQEKGKTKTSFFITPWISGIKRKKEPGAIHQETKTEYYKGKLYVTNMRVVFNCQVDAFNLMIPSITQISQFKDGMRVVSGEQSFDVMTSDIKNILNIIDLINKAQTEPQTTQTAQRSPAQSTATKTTMRESKPDTELPFGWVTRNKGFIEPRDGKLADLMSQVASAKSVDEKIRILKELITYYEAYKKECEDRGGDFWKYFLGMHVYVNGKKDYLINTWKQELENLEDGYLDSKEKEDVLAKALPTLKADIVAVIQSNPGILQKDLYKHFDPLLKESIYSTLYELLQEGRLKKEKSGNSNKLFIV